MIMITTIDMLPDCCYECPCHNSESGYCQADKERRYSDYRPYWCPLKEIHDDQETEWEHLWDAPDGTFKGRCKKCGFVHFFIERHDTQYKFCPECGREVKLDE
jgi:hypothetical protein